MPVAPLAPELIHLILGALPLDSMVDRNETLLACARVNRTFREVAQRELGRHLYWLHPWPGRAQSFLRSPACPARWVCELVWLRRAPAADVFALLARAHAVRHLSLFLTTEEDREASTYSSVPEEALVSLAGLWTLTLGRIQINLANANLSNLRLLHLTAGAFSPTLTPSLLAAAPNLHTLTLDLSSSAAIATLAALKPAELSSLRTLDILDTFVDELPPLPSIPDEQLAFARALPALIRLRHNWLYPAHLEQVLSALPASGSLVELDLKVFVDTDGEETRSVGRILREAGECREVRGLKRWELRTMDPSSNDRVGAGWMDEDYELWRRGCEERGTEVVIVNA